MRIRFRQADDGLSIVGISALELLHAPGHKRFSESFGASAHYHAPVSTPCSVFCRRGRRTGQPLHRQQTATQLIISWMEPFSGGFRVSAMWMSGILADAWTQHLWFPS